ncbi:exosortase F system-associated protein [Polaribacter sejongensis]|uniref:Exosortase F system-associated protein n=1 Tax=Polaribacter sejongensis TaxID=985043 RepID=A0AAJ1QVM5_9FLAO|nr:MULTISPECIES: exosortase F system-associated protein [Polaribacter]AUC22048.1 exosortase F system-associated protein [Polaribacter sejongensis]MDN3618708.1 exosortase F system-associated protein [Polaribacter undariae]UWD30313.1 exosortase F system-associated protein [Polaribacter undariae]
MSKYLKIVLVSLLFVLLIAVRAFQANLFYDPLIVYFKNDYLYTGIQNIVVWKLVINMFFRYLINSIISLGIIWVLFERKEYLRFASYFLMIAFVILITVFVILIKDNFESGYLLPFYIRRFIIHPLFLLILLPAFYYQKLSNR